MGFTRGTAFGGAARQYWQAGGDTSVAWDTKGNAYLSCQVFKRGDAVSNNPDESSAFYVFRSTGSGGASWNFPARPVAELNDVAGAGDTLLDKQYMTVDDQRGSPFQDRIYVTWTLFAADGTAYIYEAYSRDYGETFSSPKLVSTTSALCSNTLGVPTPQGTCNANQFSQPFTGPDGALYVVWDNYNLTGVRPGEGDERAAATAATDAPRRRPASTTAPRCCSPSRPTAATRSRRRSRSPTTTTCPTARPTRARTRAWPACRRRARPPTRSSAPTNYPSAAVNPRDPREIDVTFGSYINRHSNERQRNACVPQGYNPDTFQPLYTGVKTPGACNNDILISRSTNGGRSFTGGTTDVRDAARRRARATSAADQFWQWAAFDHAAASRSPTTTAPTATTSRPASPTSACPARATARTSAPRA